MLYERVTDSPSLVPDEYETEYDEPIIANDDNEGIWREYYGTGVKIEDHPLKDYINMSGCGECENTDVNVIYGKWCVSTASGDVYWDYEIVCSNCGKFTARSFNEND
ncbi:MAG: hypothetical protein ACFFEE_08335 [Candidatus Thorarchaeota archaeon]